MIIKLPNAKVVTFIYEQTIVHGLTALHLAAFLSEFSYFDFFIAAK